jgi:hypothetical protein
MWNFCDDAGRHATSPKRLKGEVFPCDDVTISEVQQWINELLSVGLIEIHESPQGVCYWQVTGWHHQRIDKPQDPKFDEGPAITEAEFQERSKNVPRPFPPDRIGEDRIGKDRIGDSSFLEDSKNKPVLLYPVVGDAKSTTWGLGQDRIDHWKDLFPGLDVLAECRKALAYVEGTPAKRKTARGMTRYLTGWLTRATDRRSNGASRSAGGDHQPLGGHKFQPCPHCGVKRDFNFEPLDDPKYRGQTTCGNCGEVVEKLPRKA